MKASLSQSKATVSPAIRTARFLVVFVAAYAGSLTLTAKAQDTKAPSSAHYVLEDGSLQIVTPLSLADSMRALTARFAAAHPGVTFTVVTGDNYSSMSALTFDRSLVGPLGAEYTRIGLGNNLKIASEPLAVRLAHASLQPGAAVPALGVIVNPTNPLAALSLAQLTRIFAVGAAGGDIAIWSQAGVQGPLGMRAIHTLGPERSDYLDSDDPQAGEFLAGKFGGLNMNHTYTELPHYADVVKRVSEDPSAIGITALNIPLQGVIVLPIRFTETGTPMTPSIENIAADRYPLDRFVYLYVRVGKATAPDPLALEFVRSALSTDGQAAIASGSTAYIPLSEGARAQERSKLDH